MKLNSQSRITLSLLVQNVVVLVVTTDAIYLKNKLTNANRESKSFKMY